MKLEMGFHVEERRSPAVALNVTSVVVYDRLRNPVAILMQRSDGSIFMQNAAEQGFSELLSSLKIEAPDIKRFSSTDGKNIVLAS